MSDSPSESLSQWQSKVVCQRQWLRSVIGCRVKCREVAEDLVGDVIADALAFRPFSNIEKIEAWLYRLAIRKVLRFYRSQASSKKFAQGYQNLKSVEISRDARDGRDEPLESLLGSERKNLVRDALSQLNRKDVEVLVLKYVHQWNYEQIGKTLGVTKHAVANRLRNARQRLRGLLEQRDIRG